MSRASIATPHRGAAVAGLEAMRVTTVAGITDNDCLVPRSSGRSGAAVSVRRLVLTNFRCYRHLELTVDGRPVVLAGPNGAGKTNVLEAISYLAPGRGLRGARLSDLTRLENGTRVAAGWAVAATISQAGSGDLRQLGTGVEAAPGAATEESRDRRVVHIDGEQAGGAGSLAGFVPMLWLTPAMDRMFVEGPSARRRFLDRIALAFDGAHAARVGAFERAMRERTRLLRDRKPDSHWLGALEAAMAEHGVAVAAARRDAVGRLKGALENAAGRFPGCSLILQGTLEGALDEAAAVDVEDAYAGALHAGRPRDAEAGRALDGPHRTDLAAWHVGNDMPAEQCSTGEQKALLIAILLAAARVMAAAGAAPLLLFDEVAAHLDRVRRNSLFDAISGLDVQAWMTGTDPGLFQEFGRDAQHFTVENATVRPTEID